MAEKEVMMTFTIDVCSMLFGVAVGMVLMLIIMAFAMGGDNTGDY